MIIQSIHFNRFSDTGEQIPVDRNNMLLRGCVIRNTQWVEGMVVYAGKDFIMQKLKLLLNFKFNNVHI